MTPSGVTREGERKPVVPGSRYRDWQGVHTASGTLALAHWRHRREGLRRPENIANGKAHGTRVNRHYPAIPALPLIAG